MRQAWVGCLVLVGSMACRGSAPAPSGTEEARTTSPCSGTTCTVMLKEAGGSCSVDPPRLAIDSGTTVVWTTQVSAQTVAVVLTPKAPSTISFQNGAPGRIDRGRSFDAGRATGAAGNNYTYNARFVGPGNEDRCPLVDPVICIKPSPVDPVQDTCE